jgi:PAS domain S-box-containing protein
VHCNINFAVHQTFLFRAEINDRNRNAARIGPLLWLFAPNSFINPLLRTNDRLRGGNELAKTYPYIDIAVMDGVRQRLAAGDALCLLSPSLDEVIWANASGARLFGFDAPGELIGIDPELSALAKRQIAAGQEGPVAVRLSTGVATQLAMLTAKKLTLPGEEPALLLSEAGGSAAPVDLIAGLDGESSHAALLDASGALLAQSPGMRRLGIEESDFIRLAGELKFEADRLVKRRIRTLFGDLPAGAGRISDEPEMSLLLIVESAAAAPAPAPLAPEVSAPATAPEAPVMRRFARYFADEDETSSREEAEDAPEVAAPVSIAEPAAPIILPEPFDLEAAHALEEIDDESAALAEEFAAAQEAAPIVETEPDAADVQALAEEPEALSQSIRFAWRIGADGKFSEVSPEFAQAVGSGPAYIVGRTFREVAQSFTFDTDGEIAALLERRETWSGRTVLWPIEGTDLRAPVDLAALPAHGRDRAFDGFKGFGIVRLADAVIDADGAGLAMKTPQAQAEPAADDPFRSETPALTIVRPSKPVIGQVINLGERRASRAEPSEAQEPKGNALNEVERSAFREIAERLREDERGRPSFGTRAKPPIIEHEPLPVAEPEPAAAEQAHFPTIEDAEPLALDLPAQAEHSADPEMDEAAALAASKYEEMLRDLIETADKPIEPEDLPALELAEPPGAKFDEMLRDILVTADVPQLDERLIKAKSAEEILRHAEERHRLENEALTNEVRPVEAEPMAGSALDEFDLVDSPETEAGELNLETAPPANGWEAPESDISKLRNFVPAHRDPDTSILSRLPTPVMIYSGKRVHFANAAFLDVTGYRSAEALEILGGIDQLIAGAHAEEGSGRISLRISGNGIKPFNTIIRSVPWDGTNAMMLTIREEGGAPSSAVRAFPRAETGDFETHALRREAAELSSILDTATDGVVILDADGNIRSMSQSAEALFGFDPAEIAGKPFSLLLATESQRSASDYISGMSGGGLASVMNDGREVIGREAHGRFIPLFMTIGRLQDSDGFCAVLRDMTQWKRAEEELIAARRQAEEASATKSEFLTRVSHEIRTPLNAIIGFSELMSEERFGPIGNQRYLDYSKDIHRSGRHVLDLVNDLLDISKIEAGEQEMNFEAVALNEALAESVALMQPQANRERVIIRSSFASTLPDVVADLRSIKQIALNLLSNAVRYTGAGGQVIVSTAYELNGEVVIRVRDTGAGMRQQDIDQAMKPFKQLSTVRRGRGDGTGLGLPLTKAMVEGNRAKFEISSTPGQGTLVEIKFPPMRVLAR